MSKVWIDRELLERVCLRQSIGLHWIAVEELEAAIAQPAEAEGVARYDLDTTSCDSFGQDCGAEMEPYALGEWVKYGDHLTALSAVTAERDRLEDMMSGEVETNVELRLQLHQRSEEVDALRKDAERYRFIIDCPIRTMVVLSRKAHETDFNLSSECDRIISGRDAAMAAKEGCDASSH